MTSEVYYVYVLLDQRKRQSHIFDDLILDYEPFYVGKGKKRRCYEHARLASREFSNPHKSRRILNIQEDTGNNPLIIKYKTGLTESDAYQVEQNLIRIIGRHDLGTGPLLNLSVGGDGCEGMSAAGRKKLREKMVGNNNPNFDNAAMTDKHVSRTKRCGEENFFYGKKHTDATKAKLSEIRKNETQETKQKRIDSRKRNRINKEDRI